MDASRPQPGASGPRFSRLQITVGIVGVLLSLGSWALLEKRDQRLIEAEFMLDAKQFAMRVTDSFEKDLGAANSLSDLFVSSQRVTLEEFELFSESLRRRHTSVQALEWIPRVPASARAEHERDIRAQGVMDYAIREAGPGASMHVAGERPVYFPVAYITPHEGNERAVGFDLASEPIRMAAVERARNTGELSITKALTLVQEQGASKSILALTPIPDPANGVAGFALAVLRLDDILGDALLSPDPDIRYSLRDLTSSPPETLSTSSAGHLSEAAGALSMSEPFRLGGRSWELVVRPSPTYLDARSSWTSLVVLGAGVVCTTLLVILFGMLVDQTRHVETRVAASTARLRDANARLVEEIAERNRAEDKLREMTTEVLLVEERERRHLAVDLHDGLGQLMSLIKMRLQMLPAAPDALTAEKRDEITGLVDRSIQTIQTLTFRLTPPILHELGLVAALEWLAEDIEEEFGLHVVLDANELPDLADDTRVIVFRSVRELLINVAKHADISEATVTVHVEGEHLVATVEDEGKGFDADENSGEGKAFGLFAIEGRLRPLGGSLAVESKVGAGTRVRLELPL